MKKAAVSSLLAVSALIPFSFQSAAYAQAPAGQVQMEAAESADYDAAMAKLEGKPADQAPALEAYLVKYPKSGVKNYVLLKIMFDYYQAQNQPKAIDAADKVLQVDPNNPQAFAVEVGLRSAAATALTDPAAKQSGLDSAADFAKKGLAITKPATMTDADFATLKASLFPTFYSTIGADALGKKDSAAAIAAFKAELAAVPIASTQTVGVPLQDTYYLGQAYYISTPPDFINCTFFTTRAAAYAPDPYKTQFQTLANYCYKRFHGGMDGYDAVVVAAKAGLEPTGLSITPAPTDADVAAKTVAETADLATLALSDKEFILQNGKQSDADKVFDTVKGKTFEIPDAIVITATADQLQVAVSEDAVQNKVADFTYNMKAPLKTVPTAGDKITLNGTYASYTQKPLMITMSDGEVVEPKKAPTKPAVKKAPVHRKG